MGFLLMVLKCHFHLTFFCLFQGVIFAVHDGGYRTAGIAMDTVFHRTMGFWETAQYLVESDGHISHAENDI